ncbi:MAG: polysulfide reductase [Caldithrix sp. RBG_13_44_9]|nr:MAG: polysulfide reductase [Caldithrix sp. RBG_13_44_9]
MNAYTLASRFHFRLTFWKGVFIVLLILGMYSTFVRFFYGLGTATNLSDQFPWGLWIGFDVLCGVGLAAGGFTLAAIVYIFNIKKFKPIVRPAILTAFLGYLIVIIAILFDLGRPYRIWHPIIMWNPHSVMFEVGWCVMLYTTVLALEFSPVVLEKLRWNKLLKIIRNFLIPLVILGVIFSTLHQSSLGSLYLIVPEKLYPLWYSPLLPVLFFISAVAVGFAMVIFESFLSARAFNKHLEKSLVSELARVMVFVLSLYALLKLQDFARRDAWSFMFINRTETYFFWAEILLGVVLPMIILAIPKIRQSEKTLFGGVLMVILGFIMNRLNIAITGMESYAQADYFPSWMEISVTLMIVALGFAAFRMAVKYLPIFEKKDHIEIPYRKQIKIRKVENHQLQKEKISN